MQDGITKLLQMLPRLSVQPKPRAMPFSLEAYLGAQQEIEVSAEQQRVIQNLEESLHKLSSFPNWQLLSGRLVRYEQCKDNYEDAPLTAFKLHI